ncbi:general secretion pathway protein GspB [Gallaecimonas xiamenensis]|uniref:Type II secretion system protein GspB C-terminal domain-containing protein n=1 Tax=Gallaecimonas xiamenensis 3-C-1 TaxID=745411 RepID=K2J5U9_9GAMM|nr:general secretion pathway protein GspB [Gallaecimonas xiamenensis]EKE70242.1 hypothetical protein B3C1_14108 [Gallaecimonas xiamenensis 3-C-1]
MSLLAKALAKRQPETGPQRIEGGFQADTGLMLRRLLGTAGLCLAMAAGVWLWPQLQWLDLNPPEALQPKVPQQVQEGSAPALRMREPAIVADPFFLARQQLPAAPKATTQPAPQAIHYTGHFYATEPALRWVKFNGHKLHQGDSWEQIQVLEIGPESTKVKLSGKVLWLNALTNWPVQNQAS